MNGNGNVTTTEDFKDILEHIGRDTKAETIFGETQMVEGRAIIPVAEIRYMGGGGLGGGRGPATGESETGEAAEGDSYGEGMGVGFNVTARPLGAIEVTQEGVAWAPILDVNRLALIWSGIAGFIVVMAALKLLFLRRS